MTRTDKIQEINRQIARFTKNAESDIEKYNKEAAEDYEYYFRWHAAEMYEAQMIRRYFGNLVGLTASNDIADITKSLGRLIGNIEHELINTSSFGTCTNEVVNLQHRLNLEGKRAIREKLLSLLCVAKFGED